MVAMIGDGHTSIDFAGFHDQDNGGTPLNSLHSFPLQLYIFNEGVYTIYADDKNKEFIGMKLTQINGNSIETVIDKIKPIVNRDNEYSVKFMLPFFLMNAEYLNGLGIIPDNYITDFTFENNSGKQIVKTLEPVYMNEYKHLINNKSYGDAAPLYLQNDEKNYWFKYFDDDKILYINYKRVLNDPEDSIKYFCRRLEDFINTHDIDKTIIDIRNNGGGNNGTCQPFVDLISHNKKINQKDKLFTIIGRETFSAASYLTTKLEFNTNTIFAGEPTGAKPNHYGDNRPLVLPNSGLTIRLSSIYWQNSFPFDTRESTDPEIKVDISAEDYFANRDPVLEAIKNFVYPDNNKLTSIPLDKKKALTGKYILEPLQILEIKDEGDNLMLEVRKPDFIGRDVTFIFTPLYLSTGESYSTGIKGLSFSQINNGLKVSYNKHVWDIQRADDYKLPEQLFREGKYSEAVNMIKNVKSEYPDNPNVSENRINSMGYKLVNEHNLEAAIEILKLNTELYPDAFNTYDSLGEIYLMAGNEELAIVNYKKSVELNNHNENGKKVLEKLTAR